MSRNWLMIDTPNLSWKAHHTTGALDNGVIFGVLNQFVHLKRLFHTDATVWCFDAPTSRRRTQYPDYKKSRRLENLPAKEREERLAVFAQIEALEGQVLPALGFRNVLVQKGGFEADDLIAKCCYDLRDGDTALVVSSDKDLYQVLTSRVKIWNGKRVLTDQKFTQEYGFLPYLWSNLLAIVGGHDDIQGVHGVGEIIAASYLRGKLNGNGAHRRGWALIDSEGGQEVKRRNLPLVTLPYPGTKSFALKEDCLCPEAWDRTCKSLGLASLTGLCPRPRTEELTLSAKDAGVE